MVFNCYFQLSQTMSIYEAIHAFLYLYAVDNERKKSVYDFNDDSDFSDESYNESLEGIDLENGG